MCPGSMLVGSLILLAAGIVLISIKATKGVPAGKLVALYQNTTAVISDFSTFSTDKVRVWPEPGYGEVHKNIQIYSLGCDNLPDSDTVHHYVKVHALTLPSYKVLGYLLEGSKLKYNICAVTNLTRADSYQSTVYFLYRQPGRS